MCEAKAEKRVDFKICKTCDSVFFGSANQKYCTIECDNSRRGSLKYQIPCKACHSLFVRRHSNQQYCQEICKLTFNKPIKQIKKGRCKTCNTSFIKHNGAQKYCTAECKPKKELKIGMCKTCHITFTKRNIYHKYCTAKCKTKKERKISKCKTCNTSFVKSHGSQKYCTAECKPKSKNEHKTSICSKDRLTEILSFIKNNSEITYNDIVSNFPKWNHKGISKNIVALIRANKVFYKRDKYNSLVYYCE